MDAVAMDSGLRDRGGLMDWLAEYVEMYREQIELSPRAPTIGYYEEVVEMTEDDWLRIALRLKTNADRG